jgi:Holliday junction resolvase RusA-like endonuclease
VIVTLPLPHKYLSPNHRVNRHGKARVVKKYREDAHAAAIHAGLRNKRLETAQVQCVFFLKGGRGRKPDPDNLLASMKSAIDGLVDAKVFLGDQKLKHLPVVIDEDAKDPRVEIHITQISE